MLLIKELKIYIQQNSEEKSRKHHYNERFQNTQVLRKQADKDVKTQKI